MTALILAILGVNAFNSFLPDLAQAESYKSYVVSLSLSKPVIALNLGGQHVCNTSAAFSQIPGHRNWFIGRGFGEGTTEYCHAIKNRPGFLGLYKMNWETGEILLVKKILVAPYITRSGVTVGSAYDPYVIDYQQQLWVSFECTASGAVSACIAPFDFNQSYLNLSRISIPVSGALGRIESGKNIVALTSASSPVLLSFKEKIYLYWTVDYFYNDRILNHLITRGTELAMNKQGQLWAKDAQGHTIMTDDPKLTTPVHLVNMKDSTLDHVASTTDIFPLNDELISFASVGGTANGVICKSTHDPSLGCWRMMVTRSKAPIGINVFGVNNIGGAFLPKGVVEYPRIVTDPSGQTFILGYFASEHLLSGRFPTERHGLQLFSFDLGRMINRE